MEHELALNGKRIVRALAAVTFILLMLDLTVKNIREFLGYDYMLGMTPLFNFYEEANIPTWYTSVLLLVGAVLLFLTFQHCRKAGLKFAWHWLGLALIFLFLSADETARLHETMSQILKGTFVQALMPTMKSSAWVALALPLILLIGFLYLRLFLSLDGRLKRLFAVSALLYLGGALGMEVVEIYYLAGHPVDMNFHVMTSIEETMEMSGLIVCIYALLEWLKPEVKGWRLRIG